MLSGYFRLFGFAFVCAGTVAAQLPTVAGVGNTASPPPGVFPSGPAAVQGAGLFGDGILTLGAVKITAVGGSVLPTRFNVLIPATVAPGVYQASVTTAGGTSAPVSITVTAASPAFYTTTREGVVQGSFLDQTFSSVTPT